MLQSDFERENLRDVINALKVQYGYRTQREILKDLKYTSPSYISDFISGTRPITPQFVKRLAATFGVNPEYILHGQRPIFTEIKHVGDRQGDLEIQIDAEAETQPEVPTPVNPIRPNVPPLTLGGRLVEELPDTEEDIKFRETIADLPEECLVMLLVGYHRLAEDYYNRWTQCTAELAKVKEANKVLGEIVKKHLIIDND